MVEQYVDHFHFVTERGAIIRGGIHSFSSHINESTIVTCEGYGVSGLVWCRFPYSLKPVQSLSGILTRVGRPRARIVHSGFVGIGGGTEVNPHLASLSG